MQTSNIVGIIVLLIILALIAVGLSMMLPHGSPAVEYEPTDSVSMSLPQKAPPPTASDVVSAQQPFDVFVSITDRGFEPTAITIKTGQTVRFTNNSAGEILLSGPASLIAGTQAIPENRYQHVTFPKSGAYTLTAFGSNIIITVK